MSAWAKEFLGWVDPIDITSDLSAVSVLSYEDPPIQSGDNRVFRYRISDNRYYLIDNIELKGTDAKLPGSGLQIWSINVTVVTNGMKTNRVNVDPTNRGVGLLEADGFHRLDAPPPANGPVFAGSEDDLFPGSKQFRQFDNSSPMASTGHFSICNISDPGELMHIDVHTNSGICEGQVGATPSPSPPSGSAAQANEKESAISLKEIEENVNEFVDKDISIDGTLTNTAPNLQVHSQRHLVLQDTTGEQIDVRIPFPTETVPLRSDGSSNSSPTTAPQLLDQPVKVTGRIERAPDGKARLRIDRVEPVETPHPQ